MNPVSLSSWLSTVRREVDTGNVPKWLVIGNESADLDSIGSALGYAYYLATSEGFLTVPVINIPKCDLEIRPECNLALANVQKQDLFYWDDNIKNSPFDSDLQAGQIKLAIVDHNVLSDKQKSYSDSVAAIIDHHKDEGDYMKAYPRRIETVGSCSSLIVQQFEDGSIDLPKDLAKLLLSAIMMDTVNFLSEAGRTTDVDVKARDKLMSILELDEEGQNQLYQTLRRAHVFVWPLSTTDLLAKDFKGVTIGHNKLVGTSTIGLKWSYIKAKEGAMQDIEQYMDDRNLMMQVILTTWDDEREEMIRADGSQELPLDDDSATGFRRELVILSKDSNLLSQTCSTLEKVKILGECLAEQVGSLQVISSKIAATCSRKIVIPALLQIKL